MDRSAKNACMSVWICNDCLLLVVLGPFLGWKGFFRRSRRPFRNMPARRCLRGSFLPTDLVKASEAGRVITGDGPM